MKIKPKKDEMTLITKQCFKCGEVKTHFDTHWLEPCIDCQKQQPIKETYVCNYELKTIAIPLALSDQHNEERSNI